MSLLRSAAALALLALAAPAASAAEWLDVAKAGDRTYFLMPLPSEVAVFDGATGTWLPRIALPHNASAIAADETALYVAYGRSLERRPHGGAPESFHTDALRPISDLEVVGNFLVGVTPGEYDSSDVEIFVKLTGQRLTSAHSHSP